MSRAAFTKLGGSVALTFALAPEKVPASPSPQQAEGAKLRGLTDAELKKRLLVDIVEQRFMVTGQVSKELYADSARFTDEIDTYDLDAFIRGTGLLFDGARSDFKLIGDLEIKGNVISYKFDEILSFKIPLQPRSRVSGRVELTRGNDGLIESYREFWDQSVPSVLVALALDGVGVKRAAFPVE
jgi:hypothetical protein